MKYLLSLLCITIFSFQTSRAQELYSMEACFDSYYQGIYCFVDMEGTTYQFHDMEPIAIEKYDLTDRNYYQGRMFTLVYRIEISGHTDDSDNKEGDTNEDDREQDECREKIIVDLEIVG